MTDASLPDRVEAATKAVAEMGWFDSAKWSYAALETVVEVALAAADACEAERNPNPTDALRPNQIANASLDAGDLGRSVNVIYADHGEIKTMPWTEWREAVARAVSSEDVHREAAK